MKVVRILPALGLLLLNGSTLQAQKKPLTNEAYLEWPSLQYTGHWVIGALSNDGKYAAYSYRKGKEPAGLALKAMDGSFQREIGGGQDAVFTEDGTRMICRVSDDSLCIMKLTSGETQFRRNVQLFKTPERGNGKWLAYKLEDAIVLMNLHTGMEERYQGAEECWFDRSGDNLLLRKPNTVLLVETGSNKSRQIASGGAASGFVFDDACKQLAFIRGNNIRYYKLGMDSSRILVDSMAASKTSRNLAVTDQGWPPLKFSRDGNRLFFHLKDVKAPKPPDLMAGINNSGKQVWSYKNETLFSDAPVANATFGVSVNIRTSNITLLSRNDQQPGYTGERYMLATSKVNYDEIYWSSEKVTLSVIDMTNGRSADIKTFTGETPYVSFLSPDERFVVWYETSTRQYYSYEIATAAIRSFTADIPYPLYEQENQIVNRRRVYGVAGWVNGRLLVYDQFDIWETDPAGKAKPLNVTKGYGRANGIMLRSTTRYQERFEEIKDAKMLLAGFNPETKQNGFFFLSPQSRTLTPGAMSDHLYCFPAHTPHFIDYLSENYPVKARDADVWVVRRSSAKESANLFKTSDFKTFTPLSDIHPEKEYNWLSAELLKWELPGGRAAQGILYKPDDFDPSKKYPVIFHYYEKLSDAIHVFPGDAEGELTSGVEPTWGIINIPWYVSNGYLVFVPDLHFETMHVERSIVQSMTAAAKHLTSLPFVDAKHMGLQGHSFGGEGTIMTIANTDIFAAAQETAGIVNAVSYYNHQLGPNNNRNHYFDLEQGNMTVTPWERPDVFMENSPIFRLHQVKTPLFIVHNDGDTNVPPVQAVELFTSLRRLRKPVWYLNYGKDEGHSLINRENQMDFTLKQQQYFGHFLKGEPKPGWMK